MSFLLYLKRLSFRGWLNWIIFILLIVAVFRTCKKENDYHQLIKKQSQKTIPTTEVSIEAEEIKRQVDSSGRERVIYKISEPIIKEIENHSKIDSFSRLVNISADKLKSASTINAKLVAENKELLRKINDSKGVKDTLFNYQDPHLYIDGSFKNDTMFIIRQLIANASVNRVDYNHKTRWIFGENEHRSTIWFDSKYIRIDGLDNLTVKHKEPFFDYNLYIQGLYQNIDRSIYIGPKASVKLGRFDVTGGYHWRVNNDIQGDWWIGGNYRIK